MEYFAEKRSEKKEGVTNPSQQRYIKYFQDIVQPKPNLPPIILRKVRLQKILILPVPAIDAVGGCQATFIFYDTNTIPPRVLKKFQLPPAFPSDMAISGEFDLLVEGDVLIECYAVQEYITTTSQKIFYIQFHTSFMDPHGNCIFEKFEIDSAYKDKRFPANFTIQIMGQLVSETPINENHLWSKMQKIFKERLENELRHKEAEDTQVTASGAILAPSYRVATGNVEREVRKAQRVLSEELVRKKSINEELEDLTSSLKQSTIFEDAVVISNSASDPLSTHSEDTMVVVGSSRNSGFIMSNDKKNGAFQEDAISLLNKYASK